MYETQEGTEDHSWHKDLNHTLFEPRGSQFCASIKYQ
jgi:hypothetical protein